MPPEVQRGTLWACAAVKEVGETLRGGVRGVRGWKGMKNVHMVWK